ncbi:hypothetical protein CTAYLR_009166 [Chrysophaeum taylorii]|uniref:Kinesin light chain n=1 Tax=Chrysophaeum taylorii TaxID=2483200 RepID=A0AAD7XS19_9STRA|nr:hypothetical protein CTAYLR_009166 [Chrysophaeum taylorii]
MIEAETMLKLGTDRTHPNLVNVRDVYLLSTTGWTAVPSDLYIFMDYVQGGWTLKDWITLRGFDDDVTVARIALDVGRGLVHIRECFPKYEFTHWDLKPSNILISTILVDGREAPNTAKIADFGVAITLAYASPQTLESRSTKHAQREGKYNEAGHHFQRSLAIYVKARGVDHLDTMSARAWVARNLREKGDYDAALPILREIGKYVEAEPLFRRALEISEAALGPNHADVATRLNNIASLFQHQGKYVEAEPLFRRALEISEAALGPNHADGKYVEAEPLFRRALEISEAALGPNHADVATQLNNLASMFHDQGKYVEAEPLFRRALKISEAALGPNHAYVATRLNNLASLFRVQGKYVEAEPLFRRALEISEAALGPTHADVATTLNNLASMFHDQGKYVEAEPLFRRALEISEAALGPNHADVATRLNNLALLFLDQGKYVEAEPLFRRALEISEAALGPTHADVATTLNNLASMFHDQGKYVEAEPLFRRALEISEAALGPNHADVATQLNNLASLFRVQGKYVEAEPLFRRALEISEAALGPNHANVATRLNNLASMFHGQGKYVEAEPLFRRALEISEAALGPNHANVATRLNNIASMFHDQGKYVEAKPLYRRALEISEAALGPNHAHGEYVEAEPLFRRALEISEAALGPNHADVATQLNNLASMFRVQGKYVEAEPLFRRALEISEAALGPNHADVATQLNNLASFFHDQGKYVEAEPLFRRALKISEAALGPNHADVATQLNNLASMFRVQASAWVAAKTGIAQRGSLFEWLGDGVVLCVLANKLKANSVPKINRSKLKFNNMENISAFLRACRSLGVQEHALFETIDLAENKDLAIVVRCVLALKRITGRRRASVPAIAPPPDTPLKQELDAANARAAKLGLELDRAKAEIERLTARVRDLESSSSSSNGKSPSKVEDPARVEGTKGSGGFGLFGKKKVGKYDMEAERMLSKWITAATGLKQKGNFGDWLHDGTVLLELANALEDGAKKISINRSSMPFKQMENVSNFLKAVREMGVADHTLFETVDLYDQKDMGLVLQCLLSLHKLKA